LKQYRLTPIQATEAKSQKGKIAMVAGSDAGPIGRSLGYGRYLGTQGLIPFLIVLVFDAFKAGQMQSPGLLRSPASSSESCL
jgi:hypothetical protein